MYAIRSYYEARDQGYVETVYGRRLYLPEIKSRQAQRRQYAERSAINAPMQGTAAVGVFEIEDGSGLYEVGGS